VRGRLAAPLPLNMIGSRATPCTWRPAPALDATRGHASRRGHLL